MDPYTQPYTRPFAAYSRNSPVKSTPDQTPSSYSHNRPITTYADQKDNRTAATGLAYGNQTSTQVVEERRSIKRYSPPKTDNSISKPSKISKESEVLARANEVLQRSLRLTNPVNSGDSNPPARSHTPTPTTTTTVSPPVQQNPQNVNNRTLDILNRANAILNKSANYSKDPAAHVTTTDRTNFSKTVTSFNRADFAVKETSIPTQSDNYIEEPVVNTRYVAAPAEKTTTNPRNLLSRIDQALQNSNQISANPNPYEPKPYSQNQYLSPQRSPHDYRSPQKSTGKNFKASEYAMRGQGQGIQEAYHDALRRSQEIVERNVEELMRSDHKRQQHLSGNKNLKSSYVMERKTGYDDEQEQGEDVAAPGIYLPAQGIKPKFVEEYYEDGTIYKGEKIRTAKHGRGEFLYEDSSKYEGEWEDDRKNGYGVQTFPNGTIQYDGEWKDDVYHGNGILMNGDAKEERGFDHNNFDTLENSWIKYEGEFMNGKMHGLGTLTLFNNERYVGKFKYDQVHGAGVFHKRNGETVSGEWENSKFARNL